MKDLLITHTDLDGISPIILLNLTGRKFDYKSIEINEVSETFNELFKSDLSKYENIYVTDLTLTQEIYDYINENNLKVLVFDHHESHLFANVFNYVTVKVNEFNRQTCATELFYLFLKDKYPIINTKIIAHYVDQVREIDTFNFTSDLPRHIAILLETYGKVEFIKKTIKRLKKEKLEFTLTAFEKQYIKVKKEEQLRYMQNKETKMKTYIINNKKCGVVFAESNKSELGNYLSIRHPELDLIILIDASSRISYRTTRDDVSVSEFASIYGGGGHQKASGSSFDDSCRDKIITTYYEGAIPSNE